MIKEAIVRPYLRWAGGKNWLVKHLKCILNNIDINNYHEPFLGGASIFLSLDLPNQAFLSDFNEELINSYEVLRDDPMQLLDAMSKFKNTEEDYYKIRKYRPRTRINKAARFIYLNQTSFNGIYRVNLNGEYNVPYGYRSKEFIDKETLLSVSNALQNVHLQCGDFDLIKKNLRAKDLVFLDPPYTVAHNKNGFVKYNQKIFSWDDQIRLSKLIAFIEDIGAYYILTNAYHESILDLYKNVGTHLLLERYSLIGGKNAKRAPYEEILITNL